MNTPIRKLGVVASMLFCAVLVAASYIQVVQAPSLDARAGNSRVINDGYKKERGSILVDGKAIATSVKSNDKYVYQRQYSNGSLYAPVTGYNSIVYGNGGGKGTIEQWQTAMGITHTRDRRELAEAIPPAYTEHLGKQLIQHI
mgnify:CR=1 FL=1